MGTHYLKDAQNPPAYHYFDDKEPDGGIVVSRQYPDGAASGLTYASARRLPWLKRISKAQVKAIQAKIDALKPDRPPDPLRILRSAGNAILGVSEANTPTAQDTEALPPYLSAPLCAVRDAARFNRLAAEFKAARKARDLDRVASLAFEIGVMQARALCRSNEPFALMGKNSARGTRDWQAGAPARHELKRKGVRREVQKYRDAHPGCLLKSAVQHVRGIHKGEYGWSERSIRRALAK